MRAPTITGRLCGLVLLACSGCATTATKREPLPPGYARGEYETPEPPRAAPPRETNDSEIILIYQRPEARDRHVQP